MLTMLTMLSLSCAFYWQGWNILFYMLLLGFVAFTIISSLCFLWAGYCVLLPCRESYSTPVEPSSSSKTKVVESFIGGMCNGLGSLNSNLSDGDSNYNCCKYRRYIWTCHTTPNSKGYWNKKFMPKHSNFVPRLKLLHPLHHEHYSALARVSYLFSYFASIFPKFDKH